MTSIFKIFHTNTVIVLFTVLFGGAFCSAKLAAQQADSLWYDINYIRHLDSRMSAYNTIGLRYLPLDNISEAKIYAHKGNGEFINFYQSANSLRLGAQAESYYRLDKTTVFFGKIGYEHFKGNKMGGSSFINPNYNPVDIQEFADSTRGTKKQELYHLVGAVSVDLHPKMSIGGKVDYKVGNYAKQKDLRHVNNFLDLKVILGGSYRLNGNIELGLNYYFNRTVETLRFSQEGNSDKTYESLISIGNFMGRKEEFGDHSYYTGGIKRTPMVNKFHGGSVQLSLSLSKQFSVFNEFTYKSRSGYLGIPGTSSIILTEHSSDIVEYNGSFSLKRERSLHLLKVNAGYEDLNNSENIFREETTPGETSVIKYYGKSEILNKEELTASAEYIGYLGIDNYNPTWEIKAGLNYYRRYQKSSLYPFYRKQTLNSYSANVSGKYNINVSPKDMCSVFLTILYRAGNGTAHFDALYAAPSDSQKDVYRTIDRYLYREYEYLTSRQITGGAGFRYTRTFIKGIRNYIQVDYTGTKAFDTQYIEGSIYNTVNLTLGCIF